MKNNTYKLLRDEFGIAEPILDLIDESEKQVSSHFSQLDDTMAYNQYKVLEAFQRNNIRDMHFSWNTGYGYDDPGRDAVERVYADIFHTEAALVRPTIVNGTHALTLTLMGILRPGDEMIYCTGGPYDTLEEVIGLRGEGKGSLKEYGISYKQVELTPEGSIDYDALQRAICPATRMVCLQRATGYAWRKAISIEEIRECTAFVKNIDPNIICMADNCYGEFLHIQEPTDAGIDVMAGSLIKNPGG
ncbi:MAG: methionine gamma-lyase family protein, partial [Clostridia bacterium]